MFDLMLTHACIVALQIMLAVSVGLPIADGLNEYYARSHATR